MARRRAETGATRSFLVTGGAGFLGVNVVAALLERGHPVLVLDDLSGGDDTGIAPFLGEAGFRQADIRCESEVRGALEGIDTVIHLAALRSVKSLDAPHAAHEVNTAATLSLLRLARQENVRRLVYASTAAVYGSSPVFPQSETHEAQPVSHYAASKLAAEDHCRVFGRATELQTVSLRYFNVYGPGQRPNSGYSGVITAFIAALLQDRPCPIYGDGLQSRDFIYIDDAVRATMAACDLDLAGGSLINIGSGSTCSILDLAGRLNSLLGKDLAHDHLPRRPSDMARTHADISQLEEVLGLTPRVDLNEGLEKTASWLASGGRSIVSKSDDSAFQSYDYRMIS